MSIRRWNWLMYLLFRRATKHELQIGCGRVDSLFSVLFRLSRQKSLLIFFPFPISQTELLFQAAGGAPLSLPNCAPQNRITIPNTQQSDQSVLNGIPIDDDQTDRFLVCMSSLFRPRLNKFPEDVASLVQIRSCVSSNFSFVHSFHFN